jgi:uncharacterized protein (DUF362 family)/Pyruvate/2-oxoacid:ferredoxin oxidoreductase delta subunit
MPRVIVQSATYDPVNLPVQIHTILDSLGGREIIRPGSRVLIKPNLLAPAPPEKAILTHPLVVRAVAQYALDCGATVQISDSPAMGSIERVLKTSGIQEAIAGLPVEVRAFSTSRAIEVGEPFQRIEIAEAALDAEVVINLPKLKTHGQMLLTLGVKNLFGCIVGYRKPEWHLRAGVDREMFAQLLVHIYRAVRPAITLLDGILAMEGEGPGMGGTPRPLNVILASTDAVALDTTVCRMLGIPSEQLLTNKIAAQMSLAGGPIEVQGELPRVRDFRLPDMTPLVFGPRIFHGWLRKHLIQRPATVSATCKLCGECWKYCPAKAISHDRTRVHFDYDRCIRCYCCLEICPHGALHAEEPRFGTIFRRVVDRLTATPKSANDKCCTDTHAAPR